MSIKDDSKEKNIFNNNFPIICFSLFASVQVTQKARSVLRISGDLLKVHEEKKSSLENICDKKRFYCRTNVGYGQNTIILIKLNKYYKCAC